VGHFDDASGKLHGFFGYVDAMGATHDLTEVNYPGADETRLNGISNNGDMVGTAYFNKVGIPFVCWYRCHHIAYPWEAVVQAVSAGVALGGSGWVRPYGGPPHREPPPRPFDFSSSSPAERVAMALAICKSLEGAKDSALKQSRQSLLEYARQQMRTLE